MARAIVSASGYESASNYGLYWARLMATELRGQGHTIAMIENGSPYEITSELLSDDYEFFYHEGHGCNYITTTVDYEDLFWVHGTCSEHSHSDDFISALASKKTLLVSCFCGSGLVPYISSQGGNISGFLVEFSWVGVPPYDPGGPTDPYSKWFFDPVNTFFKEIVNGSTFERAYQASIDEFLTSIAYWETSSDPLASMCVTLLIQDMRTFVVYYEGVKLSAAEGAPSSNLLPLMILGIPLLVGGYIYTKR